LEGVNFVTLHEHSTLKSHFWHLVNLKNIGLILFWIIVRTRGGMCVIVSDKNASDENNFASRPTEKLCRNERIGWKEEV
jgi:hypothetical protein